MPYMEMDAIYNTWASKRDLNASVRSVIPNDPRYVRWSNGPDSLWDEASYRISFFCARRMMLTAIHSRRSPKCAPRLRMQA